MACAPVLLRRLGTPRPGHPGATVLAVRVSPDGARVVSLADDTSLLVWNTANTPIFRRDGVFVLGEWQDTTRLVWLEEGGRLLEHDLSTGEEREIVLVPVTDPSRISWDRRAEHAVVLLDGDAPAHVDLRSAVTRPLPHPAPGRIDIEGVVCSPDGLLGLGFGANRDESGGRLHHRSLIAWDLRSGTLCWCHAVEQYFDGRFLSVCFDEEARRLVVVGGTTCIYDLRTGAVLRVLDPQAGSAPLGGGDRDALRIAAARFGPKGCSPADRLVTRNTRGLVRWDLDAGGPVAATPAPRPLRSDTLSLGPDGSGVLGIEGTLVRFDAALRWQSPGPGHDGPVIQLAAGSGRWFSLEQGGLCAWSAPDWSVASTPVGAGTLLVTDPAGRACWVSAPGGGVLRWPESEALGGPPVPWSGALDGETIRILGDDPDGVEVWEGAVCAGPLRRQAHLPLPGPRGPKLLSADGRVVFAANDDDLWRVWSLPDTLLRLEGRGSVSAAALSADGAWLAIALPRGVELWGIMTGERRKLSQTDVSALAFDPGARVLAASGRDGVSVFLTATGKRTARLGDGVRLGALAWAPTAEGLCLLAGGDDGLLRVWC